MRPTQLSLALLIAPLAPGLLAQSGASAAPPLGQATRAPFVDWNSWELVGDPGNPPSPSGPGSVAVPFWMGRYEVTNMQYVLLLNAKAALGDPLELYHLEMGLDPVGGIARSGSGIPSDPNEYRPRAHMQNKPVNFVNFYDALRCANWMHNGRGSGDTESGAYTLLGGTAVPQNGLVVLREPGASFAIPTEHEWYKAGHFQPSSSTYTDYATNSNLLPTPAAATPTGQVANPGVNVVNYMRGADWAGQDGHLATVGSAGAQSESSYACADMNGNVSEWNETTFMWNGNAYRKNRGGDFKLIESIMQPGSFGIVQPHYEASTIGFRLIRTAP